MCLVNYDRYTSELGFIVNTHIYAWKMYIIYLLLLAYPKYCHNIPALLYFVKRTSVL